MPFASIEAEVSWLTADAGARKAAQYLDQLKAQLMDCCSDDGLRKGELIALAGSLTEQKSGLMKLERSLEAKLQEQNALLKELVDLRDELTTTIATLKKPTAPEGHH